jgi:amino acid transporter
LAAGGPATAVWCWFLGSIMAFCIGSSVAELVSAYPTAGGMYFVTKFVVPKDQVPIFSWIQGWCNLLGQTAGVSSVAYTVSQMLLAAASMNSKLVDGDYYSYTPYANANDWNMHILTVIRTAWDTVRLSIGLLIFLGIICSMTTKSLHRIFIWFAPINSTSWSDYSLHMPNNPQSPRRYVSASHSCTTLPTSSQLAGSSLMLPMDQVGDPSSFPSSSASYPLPGP